MSKHLSNMPEDVNSSGKLKTGDEHGRRTDHRKGIRHQRPKGKPTSKLIVPFWFSAVSNGLIETLGVRTTDTYGNAEMSHESTCRAQLMGRRRLVGTEATIAREFP